MPWAEQIETYIKWTNEGLAKLPPYTEMELHTLRRQEVKWNRIRQDLYEHLMKSPTEDRDPYALKFCDRSFQAFRDHTTAPWSFIIEGMRNYGFSEFIPDVRILQQKYEIWDVQKRWQDKRKEVTKQQGIIKAVTMDRALPMKRKRKEEQENNTISDDVGSSQTRKRRARKKRLKESKCSKQSVSRDNNSNTSMN